MELFSLFSNCYHINICILLCVHSTSWPCRNYVLYLCVITKIVKTYVMQYLIRSGVQVELFCMHFEIYAKTVPATTAQKQYRDDFSVFFAVFPFASSRFVVGVAVALSFTRYSAQAGSLKTRRRTNIRKTEEPTIFFQHPGNLSNVKAQQSHK